MNIKISRQIISIINSAAKTSVRPKISFSKIDAFGVTNPFTGSIELNEKLGCSVFKPLYLKKYLKHELKHAEQFQIMARYYAGEAGDVQQGLKNFKEMLGAKVLKDSRFGFIDEKYYTRVIKKDGAITKENPLYKKAEEYIEAFNQYPDMQKVMNKSSNQSFFEYISNLYKAKKAYKNNPLELEAVAASKL